MTAPTTERPTERRCDVARRIARDALVEDAQWLADTGECWSQAVRRLGYPGHPNSLERRLDRAGRYDLIITLRSREIPDVERPWLTHPTRRTTNGRTVS
jgi:hypothetical protein